MGREESWLTICAVRQRLWEHAEGQLSQVAFECMEWFHSRTGTDVRELGIELHLKGGQQIRVFLELGIIAGICFETSSRNTRIAAAGDEPGIKEVLSCKGHAGAKPCVVCQNCVLHTHAGAEKGCGIHDHDDWFTSIAETDVMKFVPPTYDGRVAGVRWRSGLRSTARRAHALSDLGLIGRNSGPMK